MKSKVLEDLLYEQFDLRKRYVAERSCSLRSNLSTKSGLHVNYNVTRTSARSLPVRAFKLNDPLPVYLNLLCDSDGLIIILNAVM